MKNVKRKNRAKVSVCMACYNGASYIEEQIASILSQLEQEDELIIIDDGSKDATAKIVLGVNDPRIQFIKNEINLGVNQTFEKAIKMATGEYIFMADQDDIWTEGRLNLMLEPLEKGYLLVSGNSTFIGTSGEIIDFHLGDLYAEDSDRYGKNIMRIFTGHAYYYGCAMAFRRELNKVIFPFPSYIESHDLWIAMAANLLKSNYHLQETVLKRRIHGKNASVVNRKLNEKLYARWIFIKSYGTLLWRTKKIGI